MRTSTSLFVVLGLLAAAPSGAAQGGAEGALFLPQKAYFKASNPGVADEFGNAVAAWEHTLVVAAELEDGNSTGVDGEQSTNDALDSGAVYVFETDIDGLSQRAYLKSHNSNFMDRFGSVLAIHDDTLVVGAPMEDSAAQGVNGNGLSNAAMQSGAAYVFVRDGDTWTQQAYLKASNTEADDSFGYAVAIWGDTLAVGARHEDSAATGVDGDESDNSASAAGAVYVFVRDGGTWTQQAYLKASNAEAGDGFGGALALHGDTLAVGATGEGSSATGVDAEQTGDGAPSSGAVYVFERDAGAWAQQTYIKAAVTDSLDQFGSALALWEDTLVVGTPSDDSFSAELPASNTILASGAASVFVRSGTTWSQQAYLKANSVKQNARFGTSVALVGSTLVVGSPLSDNFLPAAGTVDRFNREGGAWVQKLTMTAANKGGGDRFGSSVALSQFAVLVGAVGEDSGASGVGGAADDNSTSSAGAAYLYFDPDDEHWFDEDSEHPGADGAPRLVGTGSREPDSDNSVRLSLAAPSATCALFVAASSTPVAFKGGTLKPFPFLAPKFLTTSPEGNVFLPFVMPAHAPSGLEIWVQWAVLDAGASNGVALSNAVLGVVP